MKHLLIGAMAMLAGLLSGVTTLWNGYTIPMTYIGMEDVWIILFYIMVPLLATVSLVYIGIHKLFPA